MRAFVAAVLTDRPIGPAPSFELLQTGMLAPIAYRRGHAATRNDYAATLIVADRRRRTLREVVSRFAAHGIELALIKGCAFVGTIYPDPAERPMNDMDVLVRKAQLPEAIRCMLALGFRRVGFDRKLSNYYHAVVFLRDDMMVELHRNIVQPYRTRIRIEDVWARSTLDPEIGARRLERVDELLICATHVARHELAVPAINYVDVSRLWHRLTEAERRTVHTRATEWRISRAIKAVLAMTDNLAHGRRGSPDVGLGSALLPTTDDVLRGVHPARLRQIGQKLLLAQGLRELAGLGFTTVAAIVDGWRLARTFDEDTRS